LFKGFSSDTMSKPMILLLATLVAVPVAAQVSLCTSATSVNGWANAATGETGACIKPHDSADWAWHCPWESDGAVSSFGCAKIDYDCADATNIQTLIAYYTSLLPPAMVPEGTKEWGPVRTSYTLACIKSQCVAGSPPPPCPVSGVPACTAVAASTAPCNPSTCATGPSGGPGGLTCIGGKCCDLGDWACCGVWTPTASQRMYCPFNGVGSHVMCNDASCEQSEADCAAHGGVKFGETHCPAARLLFA